jgi:heptosyltransferase-2
MAKVKLYRWIDKWFFSILAKLMPVGKYKKKKILFIKMWAVGDSILTLPLISSCKNDDTIVHVLCTRRNKEVYTGLDFIDKVFTFKLRHLFLLREYDICYDLEPYLNLSALMAFYLADVRIGFDHATRSRLYHKIYPLDTKQHMIDNYMMMKPTAGFTIKMHVPKMDKEYVDVMFKINGIKKTDFVVAFGVGVAESVKSRMWFPDRWVELGKRLIKDGAKIILIDSKSNADDNEPVAEGLDCINFVGQFDMKQWFYVIQKCNLVVTIDTGHSHVCSAMGTASVTLFGANTPALWSPLIGRSIYHPPKCSPCIKNAKGFMPKCKNNKECMKAITVNEVYVKCKELMKIW